MQTVQDLRSKILDAGGTLEIGYNIVMTYSINDGDKSDLDIKHDDVLFAWVSGARADETNLIDALSVISPMKNYSIVGKLAAYLGILPVVEEPPTALPPEDPVKHRLGGMVEAYEKLLIGRGINITP